MIFLNKTENNHCINLLTFLTLKNKFILKKEEEFNPLLFFNFNYNFISRLKDHLYF